MGHEYVDELFDSVSVDDFEDIKKWVKDKCFDEKTEAYEFIEYQKWSRASIYLHNLLDYVEDKQTPEEEIIEELKKLHESVKGSPSIDFSTVDVFKKGVVWAEENGFDERTIDYDLHKYQEWSKQAIELDRIVGFVEGEEQKDRIKRRDVPKELKRLLEVYPTLERV